MHLNMPYLEDTQTSKQLIIKGTPFLMRSAELQNSSMTSAEFMKGVWPRLVRANINTVLGSVPWEQIEPIEGTYCFDELDQIIQDARSHGMHLVLLWFGSFKNGMLLSCPFIMGFFTDYVVRGFELCSALGKDQPLSFPASKNSWCNHRLSPSNRNALHLP